MKKLIFLTFILSMITFSSVYSQACNCTNLPYATLTQQGQTAINTSGDARLVVSNNTNSSSARAYFTMFGPSTNNPSRAGEFGIAGSYVRFFSNVVPGGFGQERMRLTQDGKLGIGTTTPESLLSVNGNIESEEIQVKQNVADYVFYDDYYLMPLEELDAFIQNNGFLPKIQNQNDVDNNGGKVKVGELTISLMEKVEELTLHLIEMNKRIKELENKAD